MLTKTFAVLVLTASPAAAVPCLVTDANYVLENPMRGEVPVLKMTLAGGLQAFIVANAKGEFMLYAMNEKGWPCILALGDGMKPAAPTDRFLKETTE